MVPLKKIAKGIKSADWKLVTEGYNALTGESLSVPSTPQATLESRHPTIPEIIAALQAMSGAEPVQQDEPEVIVEKPKRGRHAKQAKPAKPSKKNTANATKTLASSLENINAEINVASAPSGVPSTDAQGFKPIQQTVVVPYSPDLPNEKILHANQALSVPKAARPAYEPDIITCLQCGKTFDGNKCVIGHIMGDNVTKHKCPHCKGKTIE